MIYTSVPLLVSCGEFLECAQPKNAAQPTKSSETSSSECLDQGPTIVYVPTRKETVELAAYLCKSGLRAAAYNAKVFVFFFFSFWQRKLNLSFVGEKEKKNCVH